ncbi:MAG: hypothetical protein JJU11_08210, partial [Candidatus Sumerlaeia bacterium]|nr:hypothetical protein [Candidatus Sumerlaeia bacterium]
PTPTPTPTPIPTPEPTPDPTPTPTPEPPAVVAERTPDPTPTPVPPITREPEVEETVQTPVATPIPTETPVATPIPTAPPAVEVYEEPDAAEVSIDRSPQEQQRLERERRQQARRAFEEGVTLYRRGDLSGARQRWVDALEIDPDLADAQSYIANTEEEYNRLRAREEAKMDFERREAEALEKLDTLIVFQTTQPTALSEVLQTLRWFSDINFVVAGDVRANVEVAFDDEPLKNVLDYLLHPIGLRWERRPGTSTVIISPDLRTEVFQVLPEQLNTVDTLIKDGVIPRLLYGQTGEPILAGQEITTDARTSMVIMTDSESNLEKFRRFLEGLRGTTAVQLVFESFEIDQSKAPQVKALLDAILRADDDAPYNTERKLILEGSTLILKDTVENIQKAREILQNERFLSRFYKDEINVKTWNLTPVLGFENNDDLANAFADNVVQVVSTLLYSREGRSRAERDSRRLWYDRATRQLTITDYPDQLEKVETYIQSLPQIRTRRQSKIFFLEWATASEITNDIESFLGITPTTGTPGDATTDEVTRSLRVQQDFDFRGANFRVTRVNENDVNDPNDDSVELVVRTGQSTQEVTIVQFRSEFIDDYEIIAEDIRPSSTPGEGRARLTFRYVPERGGGGGGAGFDGGVGPAQQQQLEQEAAQDRQAEVGVNLVAIEQLNALFVEYDNIEDLRDIEEWIRILDIPTLQVSIEMKFVEVITNKVKQFKPDFVFGDLTRGLNFDESVLRGRFAQDRDAYDTPFDPPSQTEHSANLLHGATVFNFIASGGNSPMSFSLRALEAQGVINVVNGATVTTLNNESVEFTIEREFGIRRPLDGAQGGGDQDQFTAVPSLRPIDVSLDDINVTVAGNITMNLDLEFVDFDQNLGQFLALQPAAAVAAPGAGAAAGVGGAAGAAAVPAATLASPRALVPSGELGILRKTIETRARIRDGGTVVIGGWRSERTQSLRSGVPILRDVPFIGKYLFERSQDSTDQIDLLIFITGNVVRD